ncbi:MAG: hypothetical protein ABGW74_03135 [Campylobacterales bacterium]
MDAIEKDLTGRKDEIQKEIELLFKANMKMTDWNIPEVDDKKVAEVLLDIMEDKLSQIRADITAGKYDYY